MSERRYRRVIMVFRRDLRVEDNRALRAAGEAAREVVPVFIFDPRQAGPHAYRSENAVRFMLASLGELEEEIRRRGGRLVYWRGEAEREIVGLAREARAEAVYFNRDYTPFSRARDEGMERACRAAGLDVHVYDDALMHAPGEVLSRSGRPYTVFTAYLRRAE
ncbi:MAG: deoxyribodipyrimidine photo-lyase, partial [bacterium]|nr:deoxyribodipyrimidine photo-lyase [bacterium]